MMKKRKDLDIKQDIERELIWDDRVSTENVDISVVAGLATLDGSVNSYTARRAAEQLATYVLGVIRVVNNLKVTYQATPLPTDDEIKENVDSKITLDTSLRPHKLEVEVSNGIVTLTGTVNSLWKKLWADSLAETTYGVILVKNSIAVTPNEVITDEIIAEGISESLSRKLMKADLDGITVEVKEGVVTFKGTVDNFAIWNTVLNTARYTIGVVKIEDKLGITANN